MNSEIYARGIPEGYDASENTDLRFDAWRFYLITERADSPSIHETNVVLRGDRRLEGLEGLTSFLDGVRQSDAPPDAATLAAQVSMFVVQGNSRESCLFKVITGPDDVPNALAQYRESIILPHVEITASGVTLEASLRRDGYIQALHVSAPVGAPLEVNWGPRLSN